MYHLLYIIHALFCCVFVFSVYSDTETDVIRKKERPVSPLSDIELHSAYKKFQKGGDVPVEGLRFPVPPKKGSPPNKPTAIIHHL